MPWKEKGIAYEQASANEIALDKQANLEKAAAYKKLTWKNGMPTLPRGKTSRRLWMKPITRTPWLCCRETLTAEMAPPAK